MIMMKLIGSQMQENHLELLAAPATKKGTAIITIKTNEVV